MVCIYMVYHRISVRAGWWVFPFFPTPLKNDGVKVSWVDGIPNGKS